jgi:lipooligosaccharide transport system ATP-binding protein
LTPTLEDVIRVDGLVKRYGELVAVNGVSLAVGRGECVGLLGPNGAGKTSTLRVLQCLSPYDGGEVRVFGLEASRSAREIKGRLGVVPQEDNLDPDFSVRRNLIVYASYFGVRRREAARRADELLAFAELEARAGERVQNLSGGMKRRLLFARALVGGPELLLLDEPTTGLDPQARHRVWERIGALRRAGTTILITTHSMEEAARLCERVVIVDRGRVIEEGAPAELVRRHASRMVLEIPEPPEGLAGELASAGRAVESLADRLLVSSETWEEDHRTLDARGIPALIRPGNLEDVFLRLTGRDLRE